MTVACLRPQPTPIVSDDVHYRLLKLLEAHPDTSQRELSEALGISLGKINYCVRALLDKGWIKAANFKNSKNKPERLQNSIEELMAQDYICLSDILVNFDRGASQVLESLDILAKEKADDGQTLRYKLHAMRGPWGQEYKPGDVIEWKRKTYTKDRKTQGRKLTSQEIDARVRRGEGHKKFGYAEVGSAVVDEYGCIDVSYRDAVTLLSNNGQHYETGYGITSKREVSGRPYYTEGQADPLNERTMLGKGEVRHRWEWLYKEVPPGTELPKWTPPEPDAAPVKGETLEELEARVAKLKSEAKEQKRIAKLKEEAAMLELKEQ